MKPTARLPVPFLFVTCNDNVTFGFLAASFPSPFPFAAHSVWRLSRNSHPLGTKKEEEEKMTLCLLLS
jgi:hypothetical protein